MAWVCKKSQIISKFAKTFIVYLGRCTPIPRSRGDAMKRRPGRECERRAVLYGNKARHKFPAKSHALHSWYVLCTCVLVDEKDKC